MGSGNSKNDYEKEIVKVTADGKILKFKPSIYGWGKLQYPVKPPGAAPPQKKKKTKWVDPLESQRSNAPEVKGNLVRQRSKSAEDVGSKNKMGEPEPSTRLQELLKRKSIPNAAGNGNIPFRVLPNAVDRGGGVAAVSKGWTVKDFKIDTEMKKNTIGPKESTNNGGGTTATKITGSKFVKIDATKKKSVVAPENPKNLGGATMSSKASTAMSFKIDATKKLTIASKESQKSAISSTAKHYYGQYRCQNCQRYWRSALAQDGISQNCSKCATPTFPQK